LPEVNYVFVHGARAEMAGSMLVLVQHKLRAEGRAQIVCAQIKVKTVG